MPALKPARPSTMGLQSPSGRICKEKRSLAGPTNPRGAPVGAEVANAANIRSNSLALVSPVGRDHPIMNVSKTTSGGHDIQESGSMRRSPGHRTIALPPKSDGLLRAVLSLYVLAHCSRDPRSPARINHRGPAKQQGGGPRAGAIGVNMPNTTRKGLASSTRAADMAKEIRSHIFGRP